MHRPSEQYEEVYQREIVARYHTVLVTLPLYQSECLEDTERESTEHAKFALTKGRLAAVEQASVGIELW